MSTALITGASAGLGRALAHGLAAQGWRLVIDARARAPLAAVARELSEITDITAIPGDVNDPAHRRRLLEAVEVVGEGLDLLVNNASTLGPSPLQSLAELSPSELTHILRTNLVAPQALAQQFLPLLTAAHGILINVSSDAAVEHYEGWGGYAASKAGLDHLTLTLGAEVPQITAYALDPGDMRTAMHQAAFFGEDISDRPDPESVIPSVIELIRRRPPSGRYRASDFAPRAGAETGSRVAV